jgi:hypothetical protein
MHLLMDGTFVPYVRKIYMDLAVYLMEMMQLLPTATGAFHARAQLEQPQLPQQPKRLMVIYYLMQLFHQKMLIPRKFLGMTLYVVIDSLPK